ncbi:MAG TPA: hypothetical protein VF105_01900 [Gemmatimonadaceae bacterium]
MNARRSLLVVGVVALATLWTVPLAAQTPAIPAADDTVAPRGALVARGFTGLLGWISGAFVGGFVGSQSPHHNCQCDDPGLAETLIGAVVGGAVGAGFGAAAPKFNSRCSTARRFGLGLLGSVIGTGIGMIPLTEGAQVITVPLFSVTGAALAERRC